MFSNVLEVNICCDGEIFVNCANESAVIASCSPLIRVTYLGFTSCNEWRSFISAFCARQPVRSTAHVIQYCDPYCSVTQVSPRQIISINFMKGETKIMPEDGHCIWNCRSFIQSLYSNYDTNASFPILSNSLFSCLPFRPKLYFPELLTESSNWPTISKINGNMVSGVQITGNAKASHWTQFLATLFHLLSSHLVSMATC